MLNLFFGQDFVEIRLSELLLGVGLLDLVVGLGVRVEPGTFR